MFVFIGKEFVKICEKSNKSDEAKNANEEICKMEKVVEEHGWDGDWYIRAYDDFSKKVGSKDCEEGKIFIESQGFCSMAKIGMDKKYPEKSLDSVKKYLDTKYGIVLLNPAYTKYYINLGEVSSYPEGYKENAGIFCHNNPWIIIAETLIGRGDRAFDYYKKICPSYLEDISDIHKMEPYVYSQMVAGKDAKRHGEAKNSWLTGTAAWNFVAITQWILGIKPDYNGLLIDPCIPKEWDGFTVTRSFRGCNYKIIIKNPKKVNCGIKEIAIDGKITESNLIPIFSDNKEHIIDITLG